jgi:catechol 2,3-dioxygenase-like lactoylglutathione lyase family enzyme
VFTTGFPHEGQKRGFANSSVPQNAQFDIEIFPLQDTSGAVRPDLAIPCSFLDNWAFSISSLQEGAIPDASKNTFGSAVPVFRVQDVEASIAYYCDILGFELRWGWGDGFACPAREKCSLFLTNDNQSQGRVWVWIGGEDVGALHAEYLKSGAKVRNPPDNFEWALEMQIEDLDGNVLRIGSVPEKDKPLGIWRDGDGIGWRHLGNQKYQRVD